MLNFSFLSLQICCRIDMGGKAEAPPLFFYRFRLSINLAIASIIAARANNSFVIALISLNRFLLALHQYSLSFLWMVFDEFCESLDCFPLCIRCPQRAHFSFCTINSPWTSASSCTFTAPSIFLFHTYSSPLIFQIRYPVTIVQVIYSNTDGSVFQLLITSRTTSPQ